MDVSRCVGAAVGDTEPQWSVDLVNFDLEVVTLVLHEHVWVGIPLVKGWTCRNGKLGAERRGPLVSQDREVVLRPSTAHLMVRRALGPAPRPGTVLLDCMCGVGTIPVEAGVAGWGRVFGLGGDIADASEAPLAANAAAPGTFADGLRWDAQRLPLRDATVDAAAVDLPFGVRCSKPSLLRKLYPAALAELARVVRRGGLLVLLAGGGKKIVAAALAQGCNAQSWETVEARPVNIGGLVVYRFVLERRR